MKDKEERLNDLVPPETIIRYQVKLIKKEKDKNKKLNLKIKKISSYINELENTVKNLNERVNSLNNTVSAMKHKGAEFSKEIKQEEMYWCLKGQIDEYKKLNKSLKNSRDSILFLCTKYEKKLKDNNLL